MHGHGNYHRTAVTGHHVYRIPIYRWRCPSCHATTSVLPNFLAPYAQFVSVVREGILRRHLRGWSVRKIATRTCTKAVSWLSERTVTRWVGRLRALAGEWAAALAAHLLRLEPGADMSTWCWQGPVAQLQSLCDLGDACRRLTRNADQHPGIYAYCNLLFPDLPRL